MTVHFALALLLAAFTFCQGNEAPWACSEVQLRDDVDAHAKGNLGFVFNNLELQAKSIVSLVLEMDKYQTGSADVHVGEKPLLWNDEEDRRSEWYVNPTGQTHKLNFTCQLEKTMDTGEYMYTHEQLEAYGCLIEETSNLTEYCTLKWTNECGDVLHFHSNPTSPAEWATSNWRINNSLSEACPSYCLNPLKFDNSLIRFYEYFTRPLEDAASYLLAYEEARAGWEFLNDRGSFRIIPVGDEPLYTLYDPKGIFSDPGLVGWTDPDPYPTKEYAWGPLFPEPDTRVLSIEMYLPTYTEFGDYRGSLVVILNLTHLRDVTEAYTGSQNGFSLLMKQTGDVIWATQEGFDFLYCPGFEPEKFCINGTRFNATGYALKDFTLDDPLTLEDSPHGLSSLLKSTESSREGISRMEFRNAEYYVSWSRLTDRESFDWSFVTFVPVHEIDNSSLWSSDTETLRYDTDTKSVEITLSNDGHLDFSWEFKSNYEHLLNVSKKSGHLPLDTNDTIEVAFLLGNETEESLELKNLEIQFIPTTEGYGLCFKTLIIPVTFVDKDVIKKELLILAIVISISVVITLIVVVICYHRKVKGLQKSKKAKPNISWKAILTFEFLHSLFALAAESADIVSDWLAFTDILFLSKKYKAQLAVISNVQEAYYVLLPIASLLSVFSIFWKLAVMWTILHEPPRPKPLWVRTAKASRSNRKLNSIVHGDLMKKKRQFRRILTSLSLMAGEDIPFFTINLMILFAGIDPVNQVDIREASSLIASILMSALLLGFHLAYIPSLITTRREIRWWTKYLDSKSKIGISISKQKAVNNSAENRDGSGSDMTDFTSSGLTPKELYYSADDTDYSEVVQESSVSIKLSSDNGPSLPGNDKILDSVYIDSTINSDSDNGSMDGQTVPTLEPIDLPDLEHVPKGNLLIVRPDPHPNSNAKDTEDGGKYAFVEMKIL